MSAPPYMRFYWGDYFRDTRTLNRLEHSAYLLLLGEMWVRGGKLPADDSALAKLALCTPDEWADVKPSIIGFFRVVRGHLTQKRLLAELAKYRVTVSKRKEAGKAGSDARHGKRTTSGAANAKQMPTKPEPEPESSLEPHYRGSRTTRRERAGSLADGEPALRVIEGGEAEAWRKALAEAEHDLPHFRRDDPDFASEIAEFIAVALAKLELMELAA